MIGHGILSSNKVPLFYGSNYDFWNVRIEAYLMVLGFDVWKFFVDGTHEILENPPRDQERKESYENSAKENNYFSCELCRSNFVKIMNY